MYWLAFAALASSLATVWTLMMMWRRRMRVQQAAAVALGRTPIPDPFAAVLAGDGLPDARAHDFSRLDTISPISWSIRVSAVPDDVLLYAEDRPDARLVAVAAFAGKLGPEIAERARAEFGVPIDVSVADGFCLVSCALAEASSPFSRLSVAAAADWLRATGGPDGTVLAAGVSCLVDGVELGALPPFGVLVRRPSGLFVVARSALHHHRDRPRDQRLTLAPCEQAVTVNQIATATSGLPADPLCGVHVRVLGGDPARLSAAVAAVEPDS